MFDIDKELLRVWKRDVRRDFERGLIETEADLLCSWYFHLRPLVEKHKLKIECQTKRFRKNIGIPDIFLWDKSGSPLVVMELKKTGSPPKWRRKKDKRTDFEKLWLFSLSEKSPPKRGYFCIISDWKAQSHRDTYDFQPKSYFKELIAKASYESKEVEYWGSGQKLNMLPRRVRFPPFENDQKVSKEEWEEYKDRFRDLDSSYKH